MATILDQFVSMHNKQLVYNVLRNQPFFAQVTSQQLPQIQTQLDLLFTHVKNDVIRQGLQNNVLLTDLNKQVIKASVPLFQAAAPMEKSTPPLVSKQQVFEKVLKAKQNEFETLIQRQAPPSIDFQDKSQDQPIGSEMDHLLAEAISWREKELNIVIQQQDRKTAEDWLQSANTQPPGLVQNRVAFSDKPQFIEPVSVPAAVPVRNVTDTNGPVTLTIGPEIDVEDTPDQFLKFLKKKDKEKDIELDQWGKLFNMLEQLKQQQDLILKRLDHQAGIINPEV